jgi:hypothetical protein
VQTSQAHYTTVTLLSSTGASFPFAGGTSAYRDISASAAASMLSFLTLIKAFLHNSTGKPISFNWDKYNSFGSIGLSSLGGACFFFGRLCRSGFLEAVFSSTGFFMASFSI